MNVLGVSPIRSSRCGFGGSFGAVSGKPPVRSGRMPSAVPIQSVAWSAATVSARNGRVCALAATRLRVRKVSLSTTRSGAVRGSCQIP
ncbi:hypothetical protein SBADM41S_12183 [Streptomyces badius]